MKKFNSMMLLIVVLVICLFLVLPAVAGGSSDKATGSGTWTNRFTVVQYVEFNAHEARDNSPAKGMLYQAEVNGLFSFTVDVDYVNIYENDSFACFGGIITKATGTWEKYLGRYRWTMVVDGGEGEDAHDYLRGLVIDSMPDFCVNGDAGGNEVFSGGNVQIHVSKSYE